MLVFDFLTTKSADQFVLKHFQICKDIICRINKNLHKFANFYLN